MKNLFVAFTLVLAISASGQDTTRLSLLFLGDIMQHDSQINDAWDPITKRYDYNPCFQYVKAYTQAADLAIGNLELTLAGPPYKGYPQFSAPDELLVALKNMGMDVLVTANNHCVDTGRKGLERTIEMLDSLRIPHTGTFVDEVAKLNDHPLLVEKNGFKLALLNYTYGTNGLPVYEPNIVNRIDTAMMRIDLVRAKNMKPDAIIVFTHWGSEYQSLASVWQKAVAEHCFKHGANIIIGAHPHVIQPMAWRKDKNQLIAYSLGNFVSGQRKRYTDGGAMITFDLQKISFAMDSAVTRVENPKYILEWVYRKQKDYYVLPIPTVEHDTVRFIKDQASIDAFELFVKDSRQLLGKHNVAIEESHFVPSDSLTTFSVEWHMVNKDSAELVTVSANVPYEVKIAYDSVGNKHYYSGEFADEQDARRYQRKLSANGLKNVKLVKFVNGRRRDD